VHRFLGIFWLINRPLVPVNNDQQDGAMQHAPNGGTVNYEPNTLGGGMPKEAQQSATAKVQVEGEMDRRRISLTSDFTQAGDVTVDSA